MGISIFNQIIPPEVQVDMGLIAPVNTLSKGVRTVKLSIGRGFSTTDPTGRRINMRKMSVADQTKQLHRWGHLAVILSAVLNGEGVTKTMVNAVSTLRVPSSPERDAKVKALANTTWVSSHIVGSIFSDKPTMAMTPTSKTDDISDWE